MFASSPRLKYAMLKETDLWQQLFKSPQPQKFEAVVTTPYEMEATPSQMVRQFVELVEAKNNSILRYQYIIPIIESVMKNPDSPEFHKVKWLKWQDFKALGSSILIEQYETIHANPDIRLSELISGVFNPQELLHRLPNKDINRDFHGLAKLIDWKKALEKASEVSLSQEKMIK